MDQQEHPQAQSEQPSAPQTPVPPSAPEQPPLSDEQQALARQQEARRMKRLAQKRRRQLQQRIVLAVLALILVLAIVLAVRSCTGKSADTNNPSEPVNTPTDADPSAAPDIQVEPDTVITLAAVGDIMAYDDQIELAKQADGSYDFTPSFAALTESESALRLTVVYSLS